MPGLDKLLDELERLLTEAERLPEPVRSHVLSLLDGVDALHRLALERLARLLGPDELERLRGADPAVAWLCDAYGLGVDERAAAEAALAPVRPYLHSHGGDVAIVDARAGVVRVRLSGACSGCTASMITLRQGVEQALRDGMAGFAAMEVEEDDAPAHPPPGPPLVQIAPHVPPADGAALSGASGSDLLQIDLSALRPGGEERPG